MKTKKTPTRSKDVPVTQKMLFEVRSELKEDIKGLDIKIDGVKLELKAEIKGVKSELKIDFHSVKSEIHRLGLLIEEQNARNSIVLDGLTNLFDRQERVENTLIDVQNTLIELKEAK